MSTTFPYPGLRPFKRDETDIFFGREQQTDQLLEKLSHSRFLVVTGTSGCGKSSLVRAGMIASLEAGFMVSAGAYWRVADMRPGSHPIKRLAAAISDVLRNERSEEDAIAFIHTMLRRGPLGLVELLNETPLPDQTNLLLLVDQFEEIFRFKNEEDRDEADAFVSLLLRSAAQREIPIYVVITMRSDFLGDCALFSGLPEAVNEGQFLTPRLTREQCRAAIIGPARVFGSDVDPKLVNNLLNDMGSEPDQLPLMQHLMMRMWTKKKSSAKNDKDESRTILRYSDYEAAGGLTKALSNHADEAFEKLDTEQQRIAEVLFRCLSERSSGKRDTRRPVPIKVIAKVANVSPSKVKKVIEVFRHPDCSFLTPAYPEPLYPNTVIDISHESLIRQWERMNLWVEQEAKSAETYRLLEQTAQLWKVGKAALWGSPDIENTMAWKDREKPIPQWAKRYEGNFKLAMKFLKASEREFKNKQEEEERKQRLELEQAKSLAEAQRKQAETQTRLNRLLRRIALSLAVVLICLGVFIYWYLDHHIIKHAAFYNTFSKRRGLPVGVGKLTRDKVKKRAVSLKLIRKGRGKPVLRMEARNSKGELTPFHGIGTYFEPGPKDRNPDGECQWEFKVDKKGQIVYEKAYDKKNNPVWALVYFPVPSIKGDKNNQEDKDTQKEKDTQKGKDTQGVKFTRYALFVKLESYTQNKIKKEVKRNEIKIDMLKNAPEEKAERQFVFSPKKILNIGYNKDGYEKYIQYFDLNHNPIPGPDKAFGREQSFDENGLTNKLTSLNREYKPMNDEAGNATLELLDYDNLGNYKRAVAYDSEGEKTTVIDGWAEVKVEYDDFGREIKGEYRNEKGTRTFHKKGYHKYILKYDAFGYIKDEKYFGIDGNPILLEGGYAQVKRKYDESGNLLSIAYFDADEKETYNKDGYHAVKSEYDEEGNPTIRKYLGDDQKPVLISYGYASFKKKYDKRGNNIGTEYLGINGKPVIIYEGYASWKSEYDENDNEIRVIFCDKKDKPVIIRNGYAGYTQEFDKYGNIIKVTYIDENGNPILHKDGYASFEKEYDKRGNHTGTKYLGINGKPVIVYDGYAFWKSEYDDHDNEIRVIFYDKKDKPVIIKDGYAGYTQEFDEYGDRIKVTYIDENGKPIIAKNGYAGWEIKYNRDGYEIKKITTEYLNTELKPCKTKSGYASLIREYNDRGDISSETYCDVDGNPTKISDGYAQVKTKYDPFGNCIEERYYGADGKAVDRKDGYHKLTQKFNAQKQLLELATYDTNEKLTLNSLKCAKISRKYDKRGHLIEIKAYDTKGKLTNTTYGYARWVGEYNTVGKLIKEYYYDKQDRLIEQ